MTEVDAHWITLPPEAAQEAIAGGLAYECVEHGELEIAAGGTPEHFEAWVEART